MSRAAARPAAVLLGLLATSGVLLWGGVTEQAAAHADRIETVPSAGATVPVTTDRVVLEFSESVLPGSAQVAVRGSDGASAAAGRVVVAAETVTLAVRLRAGRYRVSYRVVAADGHLSVGGFTFVADPAARGVADDLAADAVTPPAAPAPTVGGPRRGAISWVVPLVGLASLLVVLRRAGHGPEASS